MKKWFILFILLIIPVAGIWIYRKDVPGQPFVEDMEPVDEGLPVYEQGNYVGPVDITADPVRNLLYIAEYTARKIVVLDSNRNEVIREIAVEESPSGMVLSRDGSLLYVTMDSPKGRVLVIEAETGTVKSSISVGHSPNSPVLTLDEKTLYVCNRFNHDVSLVDLQEGREKRRIRVKREPVGAVLRKDGLCLFVSNALADFATSNQYASAMVATINLQNYEVDEWIPLPHGSFNLKGICQSPDGKYVYVVHVLGRYKQPCTQLERGWLCTNAITVIDAQSYLPVTTVLLDDVDKGAPNPFEVQCIPSAKEGGDYRIAITLSGSHEILFIDGKEFEEKISRVLRQDHGSYSITDDLGFLNGMKQRVKLKGAGPRKFVSIADKIYVAEYFSDSLSRIQLNDNGNYDVAEISLNKGLKMTLARKGERLFNDATLCYQQWMSCATCHPDGRADSFSWDLLNDGIGNPKNTKNLLYSHKTPPVMSTGIRESAEYAVRSGVKHILFATGPEKDSLAIDAYVGSLRPVQSPVTLDGSKAGNVQKGKMLFEKSGCTRCHGGDYFTDRSKHNMNTGTGTEVGSAYDTPSLVEAWRTPPYLHDGSANTIVEVLNKIDPERKTALTKEEMQYLVDYVLSL